MSSVGRPPYTASQWKELEHQLLIYKYLIAGVPVPPDLVIPIRKSFESLASRFYHFPTMGYCSMYGKKFDPEPGRCRRTDGKKWRCSKDAHPDSKYCERHMHRGRNRSRKPVEAPTLNHTQQSSSPSSSSTVTSLTPTGSCGDGSTSGGGGSQGGSGSYHNGIVLHSNTGVQTQGHCSGAYSSQLQMNPSSYLATDSRYPQGVKTDASEHNFFLEASGSVKGLGVDSSLDSKWNLMPSDSSSFPASKGRSDSIIASSYTQRRCPQDVMLESGSTLSSQQQHCLFGSDIGTSNPLKQGNQSLRPFILEWPKTRDSWYGLEDDGSNRNSFSATQLSMSVPVASPEFSVISSRSPNDN